MQALRQNCLGQTELATAQFGTIRLKLLKVAAQIRISVRRVVIAISSYWTGQSLFAHFYQRLQQLALFYYSRESKIAKIRSVYPELTGTYPEN